MRAKRASARCAGSQIESVLVGPRLCAIQTGSVSAFAPMTSSAAAATSWLAWASNPTAWPRSHECTSESHCEDARICFRLPGDPIRHRGTDRKYRGQSVGTDGFGVPERNEHQRPSGGTSERVYSLVEVSEYLVGSPAFKPGRITMARVWNCSFTPGTSCRTLTSVNDCSLWWLASRLAVGWLGSAHGRPCRTVPGSSADRNAVVRSADRNRGSSAQ